MTEAITELTPQQVSDELRRLGFIVNAIVVENYGDTYNLTYVPDTTGRLMTQEQQRRQQRRDDRAPEDD